MVSDRGVLAIEVVVTDEFRDVFECRLDVFEFGHFELGLDGSNRAFHECIVIAVVGTAHALKESGAAKKATVGFAAYWPPRSE